MSNDFNFPQTDDNPRRSILSIVGGIIKSIFAFIGAMFSWLPRKLRIILIMVAIAAFLIAVLIINQPQAKKRPIPEPVVTVNVVETVRSDYPVTVATNGTIQADIRGNLVSQIRGEIVRVSENFNNGGAFKAGDVLIEIDERDYIAEVSQALSAVSQASAELTREQSLAVQAKTDWQSLGNDGNPPALVAREPQVAAARAQMDSANARYETAKLNLERTKIKAPYTGRVINRNAVLGQYVGVGGNLAEIFATDGVEVRLPLSQDEYSQLGLDNLAGEEPQQFRVEISSQLGSRTYTWDAFVTRSDSVYDLTTRQIDIIAEVVDPFSKSSNKPPLKIGQFVNARIFGRSLNSVLTVPNEAMREGSYVFTSKDNRLVRTPVTLAWQDDKNAVIESGLAEGDIVVTTSLNSTLVGARVKYQDPVESVSDKQTESDTSTTEMESSTEPQTIQPTAVEPAAMGQVEIQNIESADTAAE